MNSTIICELDMFERLDRFVSEHPFTATMPRAAAAHVQVVTAITDLRIAAKAQTGGRAASAGGVDLRFSTWRQLRQVLAGINRTARALEDDFPGIRAQFRLPRTRSYPALLASARAIVAAAAPMHAAFVECGLPPGFLDEVLALLAVFEAATAQKLSGKTTQVASTAALQEKARAGLVAATKLDACARNYYRHDPEMLAAWKHARHVERSPRRAAEKAPTPEAARGKLSQNSDAPAFAATPSRTVPKDPPEQSL